MLNRLWLSFFFISFIACLYQIIAFGDLTVFNSIIDAIFAMAKTSVDIAIGLIGIMCLWLGIFKILEASGLVHHLAKVLAPFFHALMPQLPRNHPAQAAMTMNIAANMLGLDNAATPLGIKAMQSLQTANPKKDTASNAQILFLVLNTSSLTLLPVTIFMFRAQAGAAASTDVFLPILLATSASSLVGLLAVAFMQRLPIYKPVVLAYFLAFSVFLALIFTSIAGLDSAELTAYSSAIANGILFCFIIFVLAYGAKKRLNVYELFIDGAKEGFHTAISLIPYLIAMLVAIASLRASGVLDVVIDAIAYVLKTMGFNAEFTAALPTAFMKPFSGSGSRALMLESFQHYGVDSFIGRLTSIMQGSTETTFYVLAVYFGSVGIRYGRHAVFCGLLADAAGIITAIAVGYWFFN